MKTDNGFNYTYPQSGPYRRFVNKYTKKYGNIPEYALINQNIGYTTKWESFSIIEYVELIICSVLFIPRLLIFIGGVMFMMLWLKLASLGMPKEYYGADPITSRSWHRQLLLCLTYWGGGCFCFWFVHLFKKKVIKICFRIYNFVFMVSFTHLFWHLKLKTIS